MFRVLISATFFILVFLLLCVMALDAEAVCLVDGDVLICPGKPIEIIIHTD